MFYIYVYTNKINGHQYIGQTNNMKLRKNSHKSDAYNIKSHSYNYPLHSAIRKYGIENFNIEVLEIVNTQEEANEREIFWIQEKKTHVSQGGYNILFGGDGHAREKLSWDELKERGKVFTGDEIEDIQQRLLNNQKYSKIIEIYQPRLTSSFLSNLNNGWNYKNPNLEYPLKRDFSGEHKLSKDDIKNLKEDIKKGISYSEIQKKYHLQSAGMISQINTGKQYYDKNEIYPLCLKGCADKSWIFPCLKDIIYSDLSLKNIAKKYNKAESTIKKLAQGRANKQSFLIYPIRNNLQKNQEIFKTYI